MKLTSEQLAADMAAFEAAGGVVHVVTPEEQREADLARYTIQQDNDRWWQAALSGPVSPGHFDEEEVDVFTELSVYYDFKTVDGY